MLEIDGDAVRVSFTLPRGSYATVVLAELMKWSNVALDESDE